MIHPSLLHLRVPSVIRRLCTKLLGSLRFLSKTSITFRQNKNVLSPLLTVRQPWLSRIIRLFLPALFWFPRYSFNCWLSFVISFIFNIAPKYSHRAVLQLSHLNTQRFESHILFMHRLLDQGTDKTLWNSISQNQGFFKNAKQEMSVGNP